MKLAMASLKNCYNTSFSKNGEHIIVLTFYLNGVNMKDIPHQNNF